MALALRTGPGALASRDVSSRSESVLSAPPPPLLATRGHHALGLRSVGHLSQVHLSHMLMPPVDACRGQDIGGAVETIPSPSSGYTDAQATAWSPVVAEARAG